MSNTATPVSHATLPLSFETRGLTLRGTAYVPDGSIPSATVVLCHGFTGNRIETGGLFVALARRLIDNDIASVAFDRAGHGESDGAFFDTTVTGDLADTHALVEHIASLEFVAEDNLHLLGFSLGAVIASVVAAETTQDFRSLTLWSPAAVFADNARSGGLPGQPSPSVLDGGGYDFVGLRLGSQFLTDAARWHPYERSRGFDGPVRAIHGAQDFIPVESVERYKDVYGSALELTVVDPADHTWTTVSARETLLDETVAFIRKARDQWA